MLGIAPIPLENLANLVNSRDFNSIAAYLQNPTQNTLDLSIFKNVIEANDIAMILTFYFHHPIAQELVHAAIKESPDNSSLNKILIYLSIFKDYKYDREDSWKNLLEAHLNKWDDWRGDTSLHTAIRQQDCEKVRNLIKAGSDLYAKNVRGITPVHLAAALNSTNILILMGEEATANDKANRSWIYRAFVGTGLNISLQDNEGETPIHVAAQNSNAEILKWLFKNGKFFAHDKEKRDKFDLTPLHKAVIANIPKNVITLIEQGASKGAKANPKALKFFIKGIEAHGSSITPLCLALELGHYDVVPHFTATKSELMNVKNSSGMTAIHLAALLGKVNQLAFWKAKFRLTSAVFSLRDKMGRTPLHYAALSDELKTVQFLLKDQHLAARDFEGNQALHYACSNSQSKVVEFIVDEYKKEQAYLKNTNFVFKKLKELKGTIDINSKNNKGVTPYLLAAQLKNNAAIEILESANCDTTTLTSLLTTAIVSPEYRSGPSSEREAQVAMLSSSVTELMPASEGKKDSFIHLCAQHLNYRIALILLHPYSFADRRRLCSSLNADNKTPLMILDESFASLSADIKPTISEFYEKFRRLILKYDLVAYKREINSYQSIAQFHFKLTQDKRDELMASKGYSYLANGMLYGLPAFVFFKDWLSTGFVFCGIEGAVSAHFGVDLCDKSERVLQHVRPYAGRALQRPISWTQYVFWLAGWYRNTTMRIAVEGVRQGAAFALTKLDPAECGLGSKNYFTHTNVTGALYYAVEEVGGRRRLAPYLQEYIPSIEAALNTHLGVPTINELTSMATEATNNKIEEITGINLREEISKSYTYFRKEIAGVKPNDAQLHNFFEEHLASKIKEEFAEEDLETVAILMQGAEILFKKNYDIEAGSLNSLFNEWLNIVNNGFHGDINYELLSDVAIHLATEEKTYGDIVAKILFQPHLILHYKLDSATVSAVINAFSQNINAFKNENSPVVPTELENAVRQTKSSLDASYMSTRKKGEEAYNDYKNTLENSFGKKYREFICADGAADYLSWIILNNNPYFFSNMTSEQLTNYAKMLKKMLLNLQGKGDRNLEKNMINIFNNLNTFFGCMILNQAYASEVGLDFYSRSILTKFDPIQSRAAFAVHQIQSYLEQSNHYITLTLDEQLSLYFSIIDAHYLRNKSKTERTIHDLTWNAFKKHAVDKNDLQLVAGQYTLDEAANHIYVTSKNAAEFRWKGVVEYETRVVPVQKIRKSKQVFNYIKENSSGSIGGGASTDGTVKGTNIGTYNFSTGQLYPLNKHLGLPSVGTYTFTMPSQVETTPTMVSAEAINSFVFAMTNTSHPVTSLSTLWQKAIDDAVAEATHLPTEQDYLATFTDTLRRHEQASANQVYTEMLGAVKDAAVDTIAGLQSMAASASGLVASSDYVGQVTLAIAAPPVEILIEPEPTSLAEKALIGCGRGIVETAQGAKQLSLAVGEKIGVVEEGTTARYTDEINAEKELFKGTEVGQSKVAKVSELATEIVLAAVVPGGAMAAGTRGAKLAAGAFGSGLVVGVAQPTEEGAIAPHLKNGVICGAESAIVGTAVSKVADAVTFAFDAVKATKGIGAFTSEEIKVIPSKTIDKISTMTGYNSPLKSIDDLRVNTFTESTLQNATSVNAQDALNRKMRALQNAQERAVRTETLNDGRVRYYMAERPARTGGFTRGASYVVEHNPATGQVRSWNECYNHHGIINRVHPKTINGQNLDAIHYPPIESELKRKPKL